MEPRRQRRRKGPGAAETPVSLKLNENPSTFLINYTGYCRRATSVLIYRLVNRIKKTFFRPVFHIHRRPTAAGIYNINNRLLLAKLRDSGSPQKYVHVVSNNVEQQC